MNRNIGRVIRLCGLTILFACATTAQNKTAPPAGSSGSDPVLAAMTAEIERSRGLQADGVEPPYYIEYSVTDFDEYRAESSFGALRLEDRNRRRTLQATVRIGDHRRDSFMGRGVSDEMPLDDNPAVMRRQLWLATDRAYKDAARSYAAKLSARKQVAVEESIDDFAQASPVKHLEPLARLEFDAARWRKTVEASSGSDPNTGDFLDVSTFARFLASNRYFVNSEGTVVRTGQCRYELQLEATAQAQDGMMLMRSPAIVVGTAGELPAPDRIAADFQTTIESIRALRRAPTVSEEYHGPVLILTDASNDIFADLFAPNILGTRPPLGSPARTAGAYANNFRGMVLPEFLDVVDEPLQRIFDGQSLTGSYAVDEEGVAAMPVTVVERGKLVNFLMGRNPIRDFPASNGHGRMAGRSPGYGSLFVKPSVSFSREELQKKMLDLCRERQLEYGYLIETFGGIASPRLIYRVYVQDGRRELVRGTAIDELNPRSLRNELIAAGNDQFVSNRPEAYRSVICPSLLFRELVIKPANQPKVKLPEYPPPPAGANR